MPEMLKSETVRLTVTVNGQQCTIVIEPRTTLLEALRNELSLTGTKKVCDRGECGACTVHVDGRRILSCMTLAAMVEGKPVPPAPGKSLVSVFAKDEKLARDSIWWMHEGNRALQAGDARIVPDIPAWMRLPEPTEA